MAESALAPTMRPWASRRTPTRWGIIVSAWPRPALTSFKKLPPPDSPRLARSPSRSARPISMVSPKRRSTALPPRGPSLPRPPIPMALRHSRRRKRSGYIAICPCISPQPQASCSSRPIRISTRWARTSCISIRLGTAAPALTPWLGTAPTPIPRPRSISTAWVAPIWQVAARRGFRSSWEPTTTAAPPRSTSTKMPPTGQPSTYPFLARVQASPSSNRTRPCSFRSQNSSSAAELGPETFPASVPSSCRSGEELPA